MNLTAGDILLQGLVIVLCFWGIWGRWVSPWLVKKNIRLPQIQLPALPRLAAAAVKVEVEPTPQKELDELYYNLLSQATPSPSEPFDITDDVYDEESSETEMEEEEEDEGMATHESSDLTEQDFREIAEEREAKALLLPKRPTTRFLPLKAVDTVRTEWNAYVTMLLSTINHLIVIGASGGGKTVAMYNFVRILLDGGITVVVCDPDASLDDWPGADVYGGGDDWPGISQVLKQLSALMLDRKRQRVMGIREFDAMWFVLDEYSDIQKYCPEATDVIEQGLRRARKLNIHLMLGVQDTQVKTMGFERKSSLLEHAKIVKMVKRADNIRSMLVYEDNDTKVVRVPNFSVNTVNAPQIVETHETTLNVSQVRNTIETESKQMRFDEMDEEEEEEGETLPDEAGQGDGKEQRIRQALLCNPPWSYQKIVEQYGTSSARISRIKHDMRDEGLL